MSKIDYTKKLKKPDFSKKDLQTKKDKMDRYEEIRRKGAEARKAQQKEVPVVSRSDRPAKTFIDSKEIKKVTFEIDKELAKKLKRYAITKDQPMRDIVEDLLYDLLEDFE